MAIAAYWTTIITGLQILSVVRHKNLYVVAPTIAATCASISPLKYSDLAAMVGLMNINPVYTEFGEPLGNFVSLYIK